MFVCEYETHKIKVLNRILEPYSKCKISEIPCEGNTIHFNKEGNVEYS